jgi:hypothetical protein
MTLISVEEAKTRLADCNILLKYMPFLQKNGLSDCGRGQIMGQASLLQEYLKEKEEQQENKQWATDGLSQQQKQQKELLQKEKQQQAITNAAEKTRRIINAAFHENAVDNTSKSYPLIQVGKVIDNKTKETMIDVNNEYAREGLEKQTHHQILPKSMNEITTTGDDNNKSQKQIGGARTNNKETDQSWFNKIKKVTEIENWRSWQ